MERGRSAEGFLKETGFSAEVWKQKGWLSSGKNGLEKGMTFGPEFIYMENMKRLLMFHTNKQTNRLGS